MHHEAINSHEVVYNAMRLLIRHEVIDKQKQEIINRNFEL